MEPVQILSLVSSIIGAMIFVVAIYFEAKIIQRLKKIKKPREWQILTLFTAFFIAGYVINIVSIILELSLLQALFGGLVYLFGAIFLVMVIYISHKTYTLIFDAAENELDHELELDEK